MQRCCHAVVTFSWPHCTATGSHALIDVCDRDQCLYYSSDQGGDQAIKVTSEQPQHSYDVKEVPKVKDDIHKET